MDFMLGVLLFLFFVGRDNVLRESREREVRAMNRLNEALENFVDKSDVIKKELNDISDQIREVEQTLRDQKINFEFERLLPGDKYCGLRWALRDGNKRFRLYYVWIDKQLKTNYKPFIECQLEIRRQHISQLPAFIEDFGDYIAERTLLKG